VTIDRWAAALVAFSLGLVSAVGCGGKNYTPAAEADPAAARSALEKALDCWRLRITPDELQSADPAIIVADEDWRDGRRLLEFQLLAGEYPWGTAIRWPVRLKVVQANGREQQIEVVYSVSTNPIIHISRQD